MAAALRSDRPRRALAALVALSLATGLAACGGGGSDEAGTTGTEAEAETSGASTTATDEAGESTTTAEEASTSTTAAPTTTTEFVLEDASIEQHSAPGDGTGTALLTAVRLGSHDGYERIVFEFQGASVPGYRMQWTDQPITADGSGEPVEVEGAARLEMVFQPASGVDLSAPELTVTYKGPDRISTAQTELITDLVRTGDFEAVLSWVAGATEAVPFRVQTLSSPTRIVVDLAA